MFSTIFVGSPYSTREYWCKDKLCNNKTYLLTSLQRRCSLNEFLVNVICFLFSLLKDHARNQKQRKLKITDLKSGKEVLKSFNERSNFNLVQMKLSL